MTCPLAPSGCNYPEGECSGARTKLRARKPLAAYEQWALSPYTKVLMEQVIDLSSTLAQQVQAPGLREDAQQAKLLLDRFERQVHRMGELWERCQGKGWPASESDEFAILRDAKTPKTRAALMALLATVPEAPEQVPSGPALHTPSGAAFDEVIAAVSPADLVALTPQASAVDERAAFEAWLGIKPCGAAHEFGWAAWKARAALAPKGGAA